jgi:sn-glycerol 3-phosphate transport system ATP-binding protein
MNLISGRVHNGSFEVPGLTVALPAQAGPGHAEAVLMGVRPEHLRQADEGWPITVELVEVLGDERLLYSKLGEQAMVVRTGDGTARPQPGDVLKVQPLPGKLHWFDAGTGMRVS